MGQHRAQRTGPACRDDCGAGKHRALGQGDVVRGLRRSGIRTYAGQPVRPIVAALRTANETPAPAVPCALCPVPCAGPSRLAHLRAAMLDAGVVANQVLHLVTGQALAASRVASGEIPISPALCDALIALCLVLAAGRDACPTPAPLVPLEPQEAA
jgi:hypothetical protein